MCLTSPSDLCLRTNIKMRDQNLVVRDTNFKVDALLLTKIKFERHKGLKDGLNELVLFGF